MNIFDNFTPLFLKVWGIIYDQYQNEIAIKILKLMPQNYKQVILIFYNYGRNQIETVWQSQIFQNFDGDFILILVIDNSFDLYTLAENV